MRGTDYNAPAPRRGRPLLAWLMVALTAAALFVSLGLWQLERAEEKRELLAAAEAGAGQGPLTRLPGARELADALRFQPVRLQGRYDGARQVLLDNMTQEGQVGYQVLTPLRLADGSLVLVNRGFVPAGARRGEAPDVAVDEHTRTVQGRLNTLPEPGLRLGEQTPGSPGDPWPRVYLYPTGALLEAALGESVRHYQVQLDPEQPDGFQRVWQTVNMGPERHVGYAVQWFAFALAVGVIYAVLAWRHGRRTT